MTAARIACVGVAALALGLVAGGEAQACLPSIETPEEQAAIVRQHHAGYWSSATRIYVAEVTEIATTWTPDSEAIDVSPRGVSSVDRTSTRVRLAPLLTLKGDEATETIELSFGPPELPTCLPPRWRDHTISPWLGARYIVYTGFGPGGLPGQIETVRTEDLQDRATRAAWETAARRARRRDDR